MKEEVFNLLEEPWIRVLQPDCTVREVSLTDALLHAQAYTDLAGELATQDVAVLRLLLAVLHTVFSRADTDGQAAPFRSTDEALARWKSLWQLGHFPEKPIRAYLAAWRDRFWLFHPERPFWQVPAAEIGTEYTAAKLNGELSESGHKLRLFSAYAGAGKAEMGYAQAARWLLYINGYDDTSSKPKGKGLPSPGAGWLGKLGLIQATGKNLFETLMLNLVLLRDGETLWQPALPSWELEHSRSGERTEVPPPDNPAALLTLQSRRLLLHQSGDKVVGYSLLGGDFFNRENAFCEQMTVWRTVQTAKNAPPSYWPRRHDPAKQFWREFPAVFVQRPGIHQPGIVRWIAVLQNPQSHILDKKTVVHFRIAAVEYGDKDFFVSDTFSDELSFHASLLDEMGKGWQRIITEEIGRCEEVAKAVGDLTKDLAVAAGDKNQAAPQDAKEQFYFQIDQPFRQWLHGIDPDWESQETAASRCAWQTQVRKIARRLGTRLAEQAGTAAFAGRSIDIKPGRGKKEAETRRHCSAPEAYLAFLRRIARIYTEKGGV